MSFPGWTRYVRRLRSALVDARSEPTARTCGSAPALGLFPFLGLEASRVLHHPWGPGALISVLLVAGIVAIGIPVLRGERKLPWLGLASILLVALQGMASRLGAPATIGSVLLHVAAVTVLLGGLAMLLEPRRRA